MNLCKAIFGFLNVLVAASVSSSVSAQVLDIKEIIRRESPAVVAIINIDDRGIAQGSGSGFLISSDGKVVTNFHVIEGATELLVKTMTGEIYDRVSVIDFHPRRDIAVLRLQAVGLPTVTLGDLTEEPAQGDWCVAIGNPAGLEHTVSDGIVSALRVANGNQMIQITAPISPGSSGGPLFNKKGEVVGITSAMMPGEGNQNLNFAIPLKYALPMAEATTRYTLAEVKENSVPGERLGQTASSSNTYADPRGLLTVQVPDGWRAGPADDIDGAVLSVTNETSGLTCLYFPGYKSLEPLFSNFRNGVLDEYKKVKVRDRESGQTQSGYPGVAEFFDAKYRGTKIQVLVAAIAVTDGVAACLGISPWQEPYHPDLAVAYEVYLGMREP